jgi:lipoyl(octanoyl) transferase
MYAIKSIPVLYLEKPIRYKRYMYYTELLRRSRHENLIFCNHYPVITLGLQTKESSLLLSAEEIARRGIDIFAVKRGGDATAHEPGQIVIYPHIDLRSRKIALSDFVRTLLDITSESLNHVFGLRLQGDEKAPGLYTAAGEKVVSTGLEIRSGFSSSGLAINYKNDLSTFSVIHPCGYSGLRMQSILHLTGQTEKMHDPETEVKKKEFCRIWAERFIQSFSLYS